MAKPVILLAFANEREEGGRYLRNLPLELNRLRASLEKAEDQQLCELVILPNTTLDTLIATFQREKYRGRIAIFHYGGHAASYELLLEEASGNTAGAHGEGLIPFLATQKGLQLVFLNGCYSARQGQELAKQGIPAVIGTVQAVNDELATEVAASFYRALGEGIPLDKAWQEATFKVKSREGKQDMSRYYTASRSVKLESAYSQFPWEIYYRPGAEAVKDWNLPEAANDPYFGLPDIPDHYGFPEEPYRFLKRYEKEDARVFFGRGSYIRDLYHRINSPQAAPAILLYGQSGVGKSSLLEAGLFPRLEEEYDIRFFRRQPETGLLGHLAAALELPASTADADTLRYRWRQLEARHPQKGLAVVLDQVEEVFTRPVEDRPDELAAFLEAASAIFARPAERPKGKLLLSYRKEYDPEIEKACRAAGLPKEKIFLGRLERPGVLEALTGLTASRQAQNKYRLSIEEGLPALVADSLLQDKDSPIAPVLQITLTKLWQQEEKKEERRFTAQAYTRLKKEGLLLDDFFRQQMAALHEWEVETGQAVESTGLALDVLHFHTTKLGTASSRKKQELYEHYQHRQRLVQPLANQLTALYLLAGAGEQTTSLAHDTLAPIVQREIQNSDKPGQRALRILASKMADYRKEPEKVFIDEQDLQAVEEGAAGMRKWTAEEQALIRQSREKRAELMAARSQNQQLKLIGVLAIAILAVIATILGFNARSEARKNALQASVNGLINQARAAERTDATTALQAVRQALSAMPADESALQAFHDIYSGNEFYYRLIPADSSYPGPVRSLDYSPDGQLLLVAVGKQALLTDTSGKSLLAIPHPGEVKEAIFSPSGKWILTTSRGAGATLFTASGQLMNTYTGQAISLESSAFSPDEKAILTGDSLGNATLWPLDGGKPLRWQAHGQAGISKSAFLPDGKRWLTGGLDGKVHLWQRAGQQARRLISFDHSAKVLAMDYSPDNGLLLVGSRDGTITLWQLDGRQHLRIKGHERRINAVRFLPDGRQFFTASDDKQIVIWNTQTGERIRHYQGHSHFVNALAVSPDGKHLASGGEEGRVKLWKRYSKAYKVLELSPLGVRAACFTPDGRKILIGTGAQDPYAVTNLKRESTSRPSYPSLIWNLEANTLDTLGHHFGEANAIAVSDDGRYYAVGDAFGPTVLWDALQEKKAILGQEQQNGGALDVAFIPGSHSPVTIEDKKRREADKDVQSLILFWNQELQPPKELPALEPGLLFNRITFFSGSAGPPLLLAGGQAGESGSAYLGSLDKGGLSGLQKIPTSGQQALAVAFSPDGNTLAIGEKGEAARLRIWNRAALTRPLLELAIDAENKTGGSGITSIAFSPDGHFVLAGAEGGMAKMYSLERNGKEVASYGDFAGFDIRAVAFSPDAEGQFILIGSRDGTLRVYPNIFSPSNH